MDFNHFLTSYMPDTNVGSKQHFKNMLEECVVAEKLGYATVSIPEHHLINLLMMPSPLQMAVKIASITKNIKITTGIVVLPLHDMRTYAGDVATADLSLIHISEPTRLRCISYAVFCLKKKTEEAENKTDEQS